MRKFIAICEAQGGFTEPGISPYTREILAARSGHVRAVDNRRLARIAKLAGAPASANAGVEYRLRIGDRVDAGEPLFHVHAQARGQLEYALEYVAAHADIITIAESP